MRTTLFALLTLCLPACTNKDQTDSDQQGSAPSDRWVAPGAQQQGDVRVSVTTVESADAGTAFAVRLSIENTSPSRRGRYRTWARGAALTDNFGNRYRPLPSPDGITEAPLNPTAPVTDVLLFEAPIATAGKVELVLPGSNVGAPRDFRFVLELQTSGERLALVRQAAATQEAEAKRRLAEVQAREDAARRKAEEARLKAEEDRREAERRRAERLAAEEKARQEAEVKAAEAARETARIRAEAEKRRQEAEFAALPGKLAGAKKDLESVENKLAQIKRATSRYPFTGRTPPDDFFHTSGKYIYYTGAQKAARTEELNKETDRLKAEIADIEARLKNGKP